MNKEEFLEKAREAGVSNNGIHDYYMDEDGNKILWVMTEDIYKSVNEIKEFFPDVSIENIEEILFNIKIVVE